MSKHVSKIKQVELDQKAEEAQAAAKGGGKFGTLSSQLPS